MRYGDKVREKRLLRKLYNETKNSYGSGAYYDEDKNRLIRYSCNEKWAKNQGNRKIRRLSIEESIPNGKVYRKVYDYQWVIL